MRTEIARIVFNGIRSGQLAQQDKQYLAQVVAKRTGLSAGDAEQRVNDTFERIQTAIAHGKKTTRESAEKARAAVAYMSLWMFVALLAAALVASSLAAVGGKQRDKAK